MAEKPLWAIAGLGNPGPQYAETRHNIGRLVLAEVAKANGVSFTHHKAQAQVAKLSSPKAQLLLIAPESYMNLSGGPIGQLLNFYKIPLNQLLVIHDELDLDFGVLKLKSGGGHAGHNGLRSIIGTSGADFSRLRFGIGRPPGRQEVASFVLEKFNKVEQNELPLLISEAADMVQTVVDQGLTQAQQIYHSK